MGRKNLGPQRREEILQAMIKCIGRHGLAASTMGRLAEELGVHRTLISHYFGKREALIDALLERQIDFHLNEYFAIAAGLEGHDRLQAMLDYLFDGPLTAEQDFVFQSELTSLAGRDDVAREKICRMYQAFIETVQKELKVIFPSSTDELRRQTSYNLVCLAEQNCILMQLRVGTNNGSPARAGAHQLLKLLGSPSPPPENEI